MRIFTRIFIVMGAAMGCMDVNLLDDVTQWDTDTGVQVNAADTEAVNIGPPPVDTMDKTPPVVNTTCETTETNLAGSCTNDGNASLYLRLATDEPATVQTQSNTAEVLSADWQTVHELIVSKNSTTQQVTLIVSDVNQNEQSIAVDVGQLINPAVVITEVMADCEGPEPDGEYVKIANVGNEDVDLSGWMIDDNKDQNGDVIAAGAILTAGEVATIAMSGFQGVNNLFIPLDSSIGSSGLKNSESESIQLYDGTGVLMDEYQNSEQAPVAGKPYTRRHVMLPLSAPALWTVRN